MEHTEDHGDAMLNEMMTLPTNLQPFPVKQVSKYFDVNKMHVIMLSILNQ